jgi:glutathione S-transferase
VVPVLASEEGDAAWSVAIIEYLDETHPDVPLLPATLYEPKYYPFHGSSIPV